jgi:hypothetical protein
MFFGVAFSDSIHGRWFSAPRRWMECNVPRHSFQNTFLAVVNVAKMIFSRGAGIKNGVDPLGDTNVAL